MPDIADLNYESKMGDDIKLEYSGDNLIYLGKNSTKGASTALTNWIIKKFTYSGTQIIQIQKARGAWDNRATLF